MKIDWKSKLTSRKFISAVVGVVIAILAIFNVDDLTTEKVIALVSAIGLLAAYIVGEGYVDASRKQDKDGPQK